MTKKDMEFLLLQANKRIIHLESMLILNSKTLILFHGFFINWLNHHKNYVEKNTFDTYLIQANTHILPYFQQQNIYLQHLKTSDLYDYYDLKLNHLSVNTAYHHHASILSCLDFAVFKQLITFNPATKIKLPKKVKFNSDYYTQHELKKCFALFKGDILEPIVLIAGTLGLRRSEILGLTWDCIDFKNKLLRVKNVVVKTFCMKTNQEKLLIKSKTKNNTSIRNLLIPTFLLDYLYNLKQQNKCKNQIHEFKGYIFTDKYGDLLKPDFVTKHFKLILTKNKFKVIRFHDLRHSCATILHNNNVSLKDIQEFLGHSTITTSADIYTHFNYNNKKRISHKLDILFNDL